MLGQAQRLSGASHDLLVEACERLGRDLLAIDAAPQPSNNRDVQVGVFVATLLHLRAVEAADIEATASLGLSLGEYAHLVHIGALDFADALALVDARGRLYDQAPPGKMVAIFPMTYADLAAVVAEVGGTVEIANINSPTQNVIAGRSDDVDRVVEVLDDDYFVEALVIEKAIPMHTALLEPLARQFRAHLERARWRTPRLPYLPNVEARSFNEPMPGDFVDCLARHVHRPVRWRESLEHIAGALPEVTFVEVGPGRVLSNLLRKGWLPNKHLATDSGSASALDVTNLREGLGA